MSSRSVKLDHRASIAVARFAVGETGLARAWNLTDRSRPRCLPGSSGTPCGWDDGVRCTVPLVGWERTGRLAEPVQVMSGAVSRLVQRGPRCGRRDARCRPHPRREGVNCSGNTVAVQ